MVDKDFIMGILEEFKAVLGITDRVNPELRLLKTKAGLFLLGGRSLG